MNADTLTPGQYIRASEFGSILPAELTVTIATAAMEEMASLKPGQEKLVEKGVIYFREQKRGWVANVTNKEVLKHLFGRDTDGWAGKRITLHAVPVDVGTKKDLGIRIKGSPDLAQDVVEVTVKLPRKRPQVFRLVRTGGPANGRQQAPAPTQAPVNVLDGFLSACRDRLGLDPADVRAWASAVGLDLGAMDRAQLGEVFTTLQPGGSRRASLDDFLGAGPPADDAPDSNPTPDQE